MACAACALAAFALAAPMESGAKSLVDAPTALFDPMTANALATRAARADETLLGNALPLGRVDGRPLLAAFYITSEMAPGGVSARSRVKGALFAGAPGEPLRRIEIDSYPPESAAPSVAAAFWTLPQDGNRRRLTVLVDFQSTRLGDGDNATRRTFVYDASDAALAAGRLSRVGEAGEDLGSPGPAPRGDGLRGKPAPELGERIF